MTKVTGSTDDELNSLLTVWSQSNALPEARAEAIQRAAKQGDWAGASQPHLDLPLEWWIGFAHNLTGALTQASRSWTSSAQYTAPM